MNTVKPPAPWVLLVAPLVGASLVFAETVNRIIAVVNDDVITEADVDDHLNSLLEQQDAGTNPNPGDLRQAVLRRLIEQRLILQEAKREGIEVNTDEIAERLEEMKKRFDSEEAFQQELAASGLSKESLKEQIRDQLMMQRVIDKKVRSAIVVSPQEIAKELDTHPELAKSGDRVRASHLLVRVNEKRSEAHARALIEQINRELAQGADFSQLAKRYSEDSHAAEGGMMGWVAQGELMPELDAALFSLKAGERSGPIQTRLGFHLVRAEERRTASVLSLMEANHTIYQQLYQKKFQDAFQRWLADLMQRAYMRMLPPDGS